MSGIQVLWMNYQSGYYHGGEVEIILMWDKTFQMYLFQDVML